jgi:hypothetical protein
MCSIGSAGTGSQVSIVNSDPLLPWSTLIIVAGDFSLRGRDGARPVAGPVIIKPLPIVSELFPRDVTGVCVTRDDWPVIWISDTKAKVIEVALDKPVHGSSLEEIHFSTHICHLPKFTPHSPTIMSTRVSLTPKSSVAGKRSMRWPLLQLMPRSSRDYAN